jgi:butyryl-CoA dehydrogenase
MFTMMTEARIGVAMGAVAHASAGYRISLAYACERLQGRHPDAKDPASPQIPLIAHADVRRMLLQQKAAAEGGIAFALYLAKLADLKKAAPSEVARRDAALLLDFLTPVFKAWFSEECLAANDQAIQVLGGAGYTRDFPVEQHYRDNRLNPIHEGTNGIQALDLLGRKAAMTDGRALDLFLSRLAETAAAAGGAGSLGPLAGELGAAASSVRTAAMRLADLARAEGLRVSLAHARDFMELTGAAAFAWIWLEQAVAATRLMNATPRDDQDRLKGIVLTCREVFARALPRGSAAATRIAGGPPPHLGITDAMLG